LELYTVVVGDLVGSSKLRDRQSLAQKIESVLALLSKQFEHDFIAPLILTRGMDELSGVLLSPKNSYNICTWLNEEIYPLRFRCAVVEGLLDVGVDSGSARKMDGEAFHRASDIMRQLKLTGASYGFHLAPPLDKTGPLVSQLANLCAVIAGDRTPHQNAVARQYRLLNSQRKVAAELGITQQAVSDALRSARWKELHRTEELITDILDRRDLVR